VAALHRALGARPDLAVITTTPGSAATASGRQDLLRHARRPVAGQDRHILDANFVFGAGRTPRRLHRGRRVRPGRAVGEDWDLWLRLLLRGHLAGLVDEPACTSTAAVGPASPDSASTWPEACSASAAGRAARADRHDGTRWRRPSSGGARSPPSGRETLRRSRDVARLAAVRRTAGGPEQRERARFLVAAAARRCLAPAAWAHSDVLVRRRGSPARPSPRCDVPPARGGPARRPAWGPSPRSGACSEPGSAPSQAASWSSDRRRPCAKPSPPAGVRRRRDQSARPGGETW
jgi:hypothetical protein